MAQNWNRDDHSRHRDQGSDWDQGDGWQGSSGNWNQDRQRSGRGQGWFGQGSIGQEGQGRSFFGGGDERSGGRSGSPYVGEGGEWNRMGRYGEEGWQGSRGGGQGWQQDRNFGMDRDYGRSGGQGYGSSGGSGGSGFGRGSASQGGTSWGDWMGGGSGGYSGGYAGSGYGGSGYGSSRGGQQGERGIFEKASDEVSSWFGDDEAQRRRERDQHRGRGPKGYTRSDDRIREDVNDRLTDDNWLDASDIEVQVSGAEVTLTGQVRSREDKRRAEDIAESVSGVSHVQNNLRVQSSQGASTFGSGSSTGSSMTGSSSTESSGTSGSTTGGSSSSGSTGRGSGGTSPSGRTSGT